MMKYYIAVLIAILIFTTSCSTLSEQEKQNLEKLSGIWGTYENVPSDGKMYRLWSLLTKKDNSEESDYISIEYKNNKCHYYLLRQNEVIDTYSASFSVDGTELRSHWKERYCNWPDWGTKHHNIYLSFVDGELNVRASVSLFVVLVIMPIGGNFSETETSFRKIADL
jgi:hypothetical protein